MKDYEKIYEDFWKGIVEKEDGSIDLEQVKKELHDYYFILNEVPKVYCEVTNYNISKPNTHAFEVISLLHKYWRPVDEENEEIKIKSELIELYQSIYGIVQPWDTVPQVHKKIEELFNKL